MLYDTYGVICFDHFKLMMIILCCCDYVEFLFVETVMRINLFRVTITKIRSMVVVNILGQMDVFMKESLFSTWFKAMDV